MCVELVILLLNAIYKTTQLFEQRIRMLSQKNDACLLISVVAYRLLAVLFSFDLMPLYHHCLSLYGPYHAKTCLRTFADSQVAIILRIRAV